MIKASEFLLSQYRALLANFSELEAQANHAKPLIQFMLGDPTLFGHNQCKMCQIGYDIVKFEISECQNHSCFHSTGTQVIFILIQPAKQAVAKHFGHGKNITENDDFFTVYWENVILDKLILVPELGFPIFDGIAQEYQVEVRKYKLQPDNKWQIDFEYIKSKLDVNTKFLYIINPSNPCGSVFSKEHVHEIINWANQNSILIVADEIYYGMSFGEFFQFRVLANEGPIICLGGMIKMFFTPWQQISWMISMIKIIKQMKLKSNIQSLPIVISCKQLNQIRGLKCLPAQGTFYLVVLIDLDIFQVKNDIEFAETLLRDQNIVLIPLTWNGTDKYQGFRMLTIANKDVRIDMIERMKEFVKV